MKSFHIRVTLLVLCIVGLLVLIVWSVSDSGTKEDRVTDVGEGLGGFPTGTDHIEDQDVTTTIPPQPSQGGMLEVKDDLGQPLPVRDFRSYPTTIPAPYEFGFYIIASEESDVVAYQISYYEKDTSFAVALLGSGLEKSRRQAELELTSLLGISEREMCLLRYSVYVPIRINEFYAATNLGFSFCPNSVELP